MAADGISPALAIRSSVGVEVWSSAGTAIPYTPHANFSRDESKFCRAIAFSPDGRYLAWANGSKVQISTVNDWTPVSSLPRPRTLDIQFSPLGNYIVTFELYTTVKEKPDGSPNFFVYKTATGEEVYSSIQKKNTDEWKPNWSKDESIFALMTGGEAFFFETNSADGFTKAAHKIGGARGGLLSLAGPGKTPNVAFYVPGVKGAPSTCKIFRYPAMQPTEAIAAKSFFQADNIEFMWNKRGTSLILQTTMDVDQTGASYYGKQALHFLSVKGDSCTITLSKEGPIHAVSWSPKSTEFCVIYGFMPSKATFFNLKCDSIFEVAEAPRNSIYYNDFGNLVLLAGFGNLRGNVEVWNANEKKLLTTLQAPDSTMLEWNPLGETFATATTAPRLRMGNGFKVWHYSGALLHETTWPEGQELLEVLWQKYNDGVCTEQPISNVKVEGIQSAQPQASKAIYVPPNARPGGAMAYSPRTDARGPIPGIPINYKVSQGQMKKQRNARKRPEGGAPGATNGTPNAYAPRSNGEHRVRNQRQRQDSNGAAGAVDGEPNTNGEHQQQQSRRRPNNRNAPNTTGDPEKDKRIKVLQKKIKEIASLKGRQDQGVHLEANQVSKISMESQLTQELNTLKIKA